ncbi:MAG: DUF1624 domain-containing protein [Planctomycetes bacterium]|nr:DUF1624 domain-containing protein [Planctomycetota bacterium]
MGPVLPAPARLLSLDVFRGITIVAMILVNNPGSWAHVYTPLRHAPWHGWTPTDLVFPFFLFIVGVAVVFARPPSVGRILRRGVLLFALGLLLAAFPFTADRLEHLRIPGVLQRIAVCYVGAAFLYRASGTRWLTATIVACLLGYWALMTLVPVPGHGAGLLDSKVGNLEAWLDRAILGEHIYRRGAYDPEGILSTIPALATCLFGVSAGVHLRGTGEPRDKTLGLLVRGTLLVGTGYVWDWFFPINKEIWTSSYAVFTAGQAMCVLGLCHHACDVRGWRAWTGPFVVYGVNAITVFVGSGLLARTLGSVVRWTGPDGTAISAQRWCHETLLASWLPPKVASLAYAVAWVLGWYVVLAAMHRRGWVLRV